MVKQLGVQMNLEGLLDKIFENTSKRKKEILFLKSQVERNNRLCRPLYPMLCAHFEGTVKELSNYYIDYISSKNVPFCELKANFKALVLRRDFENVKSTVADHNRIPIIERIESLNSENFNIVQSGNNLLISTNGNPKPITLDAILKNIGLETDLFVLKENFISNQLLSIRHDIVHGNLREVDIETFVETCDIVLELILKYADLIFDAADKQLFLLRDNGA